ncbi:Flagellar basal-body rod protein FlgF [Buchnera aphidicola (Cinara piceae)]|uniref:Flagellar basal-body rod protein FlgF n=1 Tax=Buchnera aphidicola (Cinara piceae) TaxID=1660043 RepID=A0A803GCQ0_9GAMM|nr:hypothetical protein [Buchnera aphidicola]VFP88382.1 Flagellar basal-body rod protein FlgF [Buchnera aphidicola (Cinara piceae)]
MKNSIQPMITLANIHLPKSTTTTKKISDTLKKDLPKQNVYNIKITSNNKKIIKKQDTESDTIHIKPFQTYKPFRKIDDEEEIGWFSILDDKGYEGFLVEGRVRINKNREVTMDGYRVLNIEDKVIKVPENKKILVKSEGLIVIKEDDDKKNKKPTVLGQLKFISLNKNDVIARKHNKIYDLNDSGLEKYKQNELELKYKFLSNEEIIKNNEKSTQNLINKINLIRSFEFDTIKKKK